jgi:hypothetical protein
LVKGHAFGGWNADILFTHERLIVATVEEEGDMREFLGLGDTQLAQAGAADDFAKGILDLCWSESNRQTLELFVVQREEHESEIPKIMPWEAIPLRLDKRFRQLDFAFTAATAKDHRVAILDTTDSPALCVHQDNRFEPVIRLSLAIRFSHCSTKHDSTARKMTLGHNPLL